MSNNEFGSGGPTSGSDTTSGLPIEIDRHEVDLGADVDRTPTNRDSALEDAASSGGGEINANTADLGADAQRPSSEG